MKLRFASVLLALALPLCAQDPAATDPTEAIFYKAFFLEKGQRDFVGAMALYEQFLAKAPEHKLAGDAAKQQFQLLDRTGKTKERDAFKAKYEKLLGNVATAPAGGGGGDAAGRGDRPARGEGGERPAGGGAGAGGGARMDPAARLADLEKQLAKAKEEGKEEEVKRISEQIERAKAGRGAGGGGQPGQGARRGGLFGALGGKKIAEMTDEEITQLKDGLGAAAPMIERMKEGNPEAAGKMEKGVADLKKALDAGNKEDAQKAMDALREAMPRRGRGGEAGGAGAGGGGARPAGGGGGNSGGGGGGGGN